MTFFGFKNVESACLMKSKFIPIDMNDPMNGLVTYLKKENKLNEYLSIKASSTLSSGSIRASVNTLFNRTNDPFFQFGENKIGEYFEINFLKQTFLHYQRMDSWYRQLIHSNQEIGTFRACQQIHRRF